MSNLLSVLLGAVIASIVPLVTLVLNNSRWKKEKLVEHLRIKHDRLEQVYKKIHEALPKAIAENSYPSSVTSAITTFASAEVKEIFIKFMADKNKDETISKNLIFNISEAANRDLLSIEKKIENILS